ncbi:MAG: helix-turn-helix domain-containing protein [Panacibacter sp.]
MFVIFQLLFISIFLFSKETGKRVSNILLGLFFLCFCLSLIDSFLLKMEWYNSYPSLANMSAAFPLLYGPFLFFYTQSLVYKDFRFDKNKILQFVPFMLLFFTSFISYNLLPDGEKINLLRSIKQRAIPIYVFVIAALMMLHFCVYAIISLKLIRQYRQLASDHFSDEQKVNLSWLSSTIIFFIALFIFSVVNSFIGSASLANYYYFSLTLLIAAIFIFINRVLFKALKKPAIFSWVAEKEIKQVQPIMEKVAAEITVTETDAKNLELLIELMQNRKPWLEPELTVDTLAQQISMRPKELSRLINENLHQNFFDFINRYRIDEAKRLLTNPADKKITVLEVLYEVGFNSKSSFNTLFKKYTGITPSEFKKQNMQ